MTTSTTSSAKSSHLLITQPRSRRSLLLILSTTTKIIRRKDRLLQTLYPTSNTRNGSTRNVFIGHLPWLDRYPFPTPRRQVQHPFTGLPFLSSSVISLTVSSYLRDSVLTCLTVWVKCGICSADSLINILLCTLGYLPGLLHSWYV